MKSVVLWHPGLAGAMVGAGGAAVCAGRVRGNLQSAPLSFMKIPPLLACTCSVAVASALTISQSNMNFSLSGRIIEVINCSNGLWPENHKLLFNVVK